MEKSSKCLQTSNKLKNKKKAIFKTKSHCIILMQKLISVDLTTHEEAKTKNCSKSKIVYIGLEKTRESVYDNEQLEKYGISI